MAKKELGSITRTVAAVVCGAVIGKAFDSGISLETMETIAENIDYILALGGIISVQLWSFIDKQKAKSVEKELKTLKKREYND